jgi:hypothetical protein
MISIIFEKETPHGLYRDSLWLDENHSLSESEIEALKQERVDNWIAFINLPREEGEIHG